MTAPAVREPTVAMLRNVSEELAANVAQGIGIRKLPAALPKAIERPAKPEVKESPALSLLARPGDGGIKGRKVAILVADGVEPAALHAVQAALLDQGAVGRFVAQHIGPVTLADGTEIDADASLENSPGFLFDGLVLPDGEAGVNLLAGDGHSAEFVRDQFRHCKPILALGASKALLAEAGIPLPEDDPAFIMAAGNDQAAVQRFITALGQPRNFARESDPPVV